MVNSTLAVISRSSIGLLITFTLILKLIPCFLLLALKSNCRYAFKQTQITRNVMGVKSCNTKSAVCPFCSIL